MEILVVVVEEEEGGEGESRQEECEDAEGGDTHCRRLLVCHLLICGVE